jgi:hypothetical protein
MRCEQFLFENAYVLESGSSENLRRDALDHMRACASCRAQFRQLRLDSRFIESEPPALVSQRLHQALDLAIADSSAQLEQRLSFARMWPQMALAVLILVGSIAGIAYQSHPTINPSIYARR